MFHRHKWYIDHSHPGCTTLRCAGCDKLRPNRMRWHEGVWFWALGLRGKSKRRREMEKMAIAARDRYRAE